MGETTSAEATKNHDKQGSRKGEKGSIRGKRGSIRGKRRKHSRENRETPTGKPGTVDGRRRNGQRQAARWPTENRNRPTENRETPTGNREPADDGRRGGHGGGYDEGALGRPARPQSQLWLMVVRTVAAAAAALCYIRYWLLIDSLFSTRRMVSAMRSAMEICFTLLLCLV